MTKRPLRVEVRALNPGPAADEIVRRFETWFVPDGQDLVFRSWLRDSDDLNADLKWLHGMLVHFRKFIRTVEAKGVVWVARVYVDRLPIVIEPESLLLAHQLHMKVEIVQGDRTGCDGCGF